MIDIHSHFLPGLDDGAQTEEASLAMLELAVGDGTTHIVGSPHCNFEYSFSPSRNLELASALQAKLGDRIRLLTGCDFHLSYENLERALEDPSQFAIDQGNYLLTEFGNYSVPPKIENSFHQLRLKQVVPIITHPERIPMLMEDRFDLIRQLVGMGCPVQITAGSLTGRFGKRARAACFKLLDWRMAHFVASDAHDTEHRPPRLSNARAIVSEKYGEEIAQALFIDNPRAAIESQPMPYFPEAAEPPRKRRWWFF